MRTRVSQPIELAAPRLFGLPLILIALLGAIFTVYRFGLHVINPASIGWFQGDSTWHFLVWHVFRREPWGFPPGQVEGFMAPLGTSIGSADALPLLAFPLKLFGVFLPTNFQYLGPWLLICYVLQGIFGYLLARTFCRNRWLALLAGLFFLFSPIMIFRAGHIALASHWILLFALWHYFATAQHADFRFRSYAGRWLLVTALVGLIHPYLAAMVFPIALASLWREWRFSKRLAPRSAFALFVAMSVLLAFEWWLSGLIGAGQNLEMWGFDHFSMNLNALINPLTRSTLLTPLPLGEGQYEGFAYLGLGGLLLGVGALYLLLRTAPRTAPQRLFTRLRTSGHFPLALLAVGFTLFALGRTVMFGDVRLFELPLFTNFTTLTTTFRAPGRFFWPTYYLLYVLILSYLVRRLPLGPAALVLGVGFVIQMVDLRINAPFPNSQRTFSENLPDEWWRQVVAPFNTVAVIPAFERTTVGQGDYADFTFLAASQGKAVTTGAAARPPRDLERVKQELEEEAVLGPRNPETLYVFNPVRFATAYLTKLAPGLQCYELGGYILCHSTEAAVGNDIREVGLGAPLDLNTYVPPGYTRVTLADYLRRYDDQTLVIVAREGVGNELDVAGSFLAEKGLQLGQLAPEGAYAVVLHQGQVAFEGIGEDEAVQRLWTKGTLIEEEGSAKLTVPKNLRVLSESTEDVQRAQILVGGAPVMRLDRGLNVAVLDEQFEVVSTATFDTFVTDEGIIEE